MKQPDILLRSLRALLPTAVIRQTQLLLPVPIRLWLIDPDGMDVPLTEAETNAIFESPPYWSFCWGSGKAMAQWLMAHPEEVSGKTVLDFGSGSGVVAIAAAIAGARKVIVCDIDPIALSAVKNNMAINQQYLNGAQIDYLDDFFQLNETVDVLLAADVLYDPDNLPLVRVFREKASSVLVADSRVKNFGSEGFSYIGEQFSVTEPDLGENEDVKTVRFYRANGQRCDEKFEEND